MLLALTSTPVTDAYADYAATADASPAANDVPLLLAAASDSPALPNGMTRITGRIVAIQGNYITVETRGARTITVDLSEALHASQTAVPVVGNAVVVTGRFAASGVLHAEQMLRAKSSEDLWRPDEGPQ